MIFNAASLSNKVGDEKVMMIGEVNQVKMGWTWALQGVSWAFT